MPIISGTNLCTWETLTPCTAEHSSTAQHGTTHYFWSDWSSINCCFGDLNDEVAVGTGSLCLQARVSFPFSVHWLFFHSYPVLLQSLPSPSGLWEWQMWAVRATTVAARDRATSKLTPQPMVFIPMPSSCAFWLLSGAPHSWLLLISCFSLSYHCFFCTLNNCHLLFSPLSLLF